MGYRSGARRGAAEMLAGTSASGTRQSSVQGCIHSVPSKRLSRLVTRGIGAPGSQEMYGFGLPIVGIPCDAFLRGIHPFHGVGEKYIDAVAHGAGVMPILLPALGGGTDLEPITIAPERVVDSF